MSKVRWRIFYKYMAFGSGVVSLLFGLWYYSRGQWMDRPIDTSPEVRRGNANFTDLESGRARLDKLHEDIRQNMESGNPSGSERVVDLVEINEISDPVQLIEIAKDEGSSPAQAAISLMRLAKLGASAELISLYVDIMPRRRVDVLRALAQTGGAVEWSYVVDHLGELLNFQREDVLQNMALVIQELDPASDKRASLLAGLPDRERLEVIEIMNKFESDLRIYQEMKEKSQ